MGFLRATGWFLERKRFSTLSGAASDTFWTFRIGCYKFMAWKMRIAMIEHLNTFKGPVTLRSIPLEWLVGCQVAHFKAKQPEHKKTNSVQRSRSNFLVTSNQYFSAVFVHSKKRLVFQCFSYIKSCSTLQA